MSIINKLLCTFKLVKCPIYLPQSSAIARRDLHAGGRRLPPHPRTFGGDSLGVEDPEPFAARSLLLIPSCRGSCGIPTGMRPILRYGWVYVFCTIVGIIHSDLAHSLTYVLCSAREKRQADFVDCDSNFDTTRSRILHLSDPKNS